MLSKLRQNKGQVFSSEYVLIFFLIVGMVVAMSIYFRRAVQARMFDARVLMVSHVNQVRDDYGVVGNYHYEYEPYYTDSQAEVTRTVGSVKELKQGGTSGIYEMSYPDGFFETNAETQSMTKPPREAR